MQCRECDDTRECGGLLQWLKDHHDCPLCRHPLPSETESGVWECAGCDQQNPMSSRRCPSCQCAQNVRRAFSSPSHQEAFDRAAALIWGLRLSSTPEVKAALQKQWQQLMESRMLSELQQAQWAVKGALQYIWACECSALGSGDSPSYSAEDAGAAGDADVNSRGMIRMFWKMLQPDFDHAALIAKVERDYGPSRLVRATSGEATAVAQLVGQSAIAFTEQLSNAIVHGGTEAEWATLEADIADYVQRNWTIHLPVMMMRDAAVRDMPLLAEGIDPRSAQFVQYILNEVIRKEGELTEATETAEPVEAEGAAPGGVGRWFCETDQGRVPYDAAISAQIEAAYSAGEPTVDFQRGEGHNYSIEFETMTQTRGDGYGTQRGVVREAPQTEDDDALALVRTKSFGSLSRDTLGMLQAEASEQFVSVVKTLRKVVENVLQHRSQEKYRRLRLSKKAIQEKVAKYESAMRILESVGFKLTIDEGTGDQLLQMATVDGDKLSRLLHIIDSVLG